METSSTPPAVRHSDGEASQQRLSLGWLAGDSQSGQLDMFGTDVRMFQKVRLVISSLQ
jgi:hypothetical protein